MRYSNADEAQQFSVLKSALALLQELPFGANPPEIGYQIDQLVHQMVEIRDPYAEAKKTSTQQAMALYPEMKLLVKQSPDPLATAIRLSIAGNIIDFAMSDQIADLRMTMERVLQQPYAIDDRTELLHRLNHASHVLFLADNAGETVFDRVLIEELSLPVKYAVKELPVLNDATLEDALDAGLDTCAKIISNGTQAAGTILRLCSSEFHEQFEKAPLIIAKGQANYETLSDAGDKIFCLLQVKCPVIGTDLDAPVGSIVVRQSTSS